MAISIEEFSKEFFQEIIMEADASGCLTEDVFFDKFCEHLTDSGDLETADRADYRGQPGSGIRVDGYGGDPINSSGTLSLIIVDYNHSAEVSRLIGSEMNTLFQRLSKFLKKALDSKWRNSLEETSPAFGLADLISQRWNGVSRVRMFLISNRELSERVDGREANEFDGRPVTYSVWDIKRLHRFATVSHGHEDIEIDLVDGFGTALPLLPAHLSADYEAYLAVLPGSMLGAIYDYWGARLLEQNVRVFLQARGNVNKGIKGTLENSPSMFFAYNNGITATAESVTIEERNGQPFLTALKNFQIVNGGQTTASVHVAYMNKVDLSKVFVQMKLSIVDPVRSEDVVPKISEYANSQNRVNAADFFANHPFHVRMEAFSRRMYAPSPDGTFRETKWFYERARGQYADARSLLTPAQRKKFDLENPRSQLISKTDLAKYLHVWDQHPDKVSLGAQKNFAHFAQSVGVAWKNSDEIFNESYYREAVAKAIFFKAAEKIVSNQPWYQGGYRANIVAYSISKMAYDVLDMKRAMDFSLIWKAQSISEPIEKTLAHVAKSVCDVLVDTPPGISNVTEWAKKQACWARIKELKIHWPKYFINILISQEENNSTKKSARKEQKILNGIEAQTAVFTAGPAFWREALAWGQEKNILSATEAGVLSVACNIPNKIPTERQAIKTVETVAKLKREGFVCDFIT
uniref:AIPR family protein n=1 Tax=Marinobacterium profundum TaxID=1714300 RepID=UPI00082A0D60|nr:AIPR family protein [Marinobacterium profundum]